MSDLNKPSMFRKGGLLMPNGAYTEVGKNLDGSFYIQIADKRAQFTPKQAFDLAIGLLKVQGYNLELGNGPQETIQ